MNLRGIIVAAAFATTVGAGAAFAAESVTLKTTELGQGPTIVFMHELGAGRMTWMPVARKLVGRYHVVLVDLPGHGESPMPDHFTFPGAAEALDRVMAKQKPDSTVLVGHGVGGVIALYEASAHPERLRGVVVLTAAARSPVPMPDQQREMFLKQIDQNYADFVKAMFTQQARDSAQAVAVNAQVALVPAPTMKAYLREWLMLDASSAVKNLKVPLLYVGSEKSWPAGESWAEMAKKFGYDGAPDATSRRIGASGHYVAQDQPDSVATAIADFAARTLAGAPAKR
ncbi:MAG TPA: alpha/beta hydrolase [Candidatus Eisenbacteria bacterium]